MLNGNVNVRKIHSNKMMFGFDETAFTECTMVKYSYRWSRLKRLLSFLAISHLPHHRFPHDSRYSYEWKETYEYVCASIHIRLENRVNGAYELSTMPASLNHIQDEMNMIIVYLRNVSNGLLFIRRNKSLKLRWQGWIQFSRIIIVILFWIKLLNLNEIILVYKM